MKQTKRSNRIWTVSRTELIGHFSSSCSFKEVINKLGIHMPVSQGVYYRQLKERISEEQLDISEFLERNKEFLRNTHKSAEKSNLKDDSEVFIVNSRMDRHGIKRRIIKRNLLPYCCEKCNNPGIWMNQKISLELDHKNGVNNDNRIENLRFLCPNCHSLEPTSKGAKRKKSWLCKCGKKMNRSSDLCIACSKELRKDIVETRKFNPSKQELWQKCKELNWNFCALGRFYGVSDNAIRKRCKKYSIEVNGENFEISTSTV